MAEGQETSDYPGSLDSWVTLTDKEDLAEVSDINKIKAAVEAIQTELGTDPAGTKTDVDERLDQCIAEDGAMRQGTSFPGTPGEGDFFYRTDEDIMYIYDGAEWDSVGITLSNVIFSWLGYDGATGSDVGTGMYSGNAQTPDTASTNLFWTRRGSNSTAYETIVPIFKWTKIAGISTLTIFVRSWADGSGKNWTLRFDAGGQTGSLTVSATHNTPSWRTSFTVDVSGLSDGTTYDMKLESATANTGYTFNHYVSGLMVIGS